VMGRSHCPRCSRTLEWYELVPVLSFIALLGKCRTCHARISWQYPLVEIVTALGVVAIGLAPLSIALKAIGILIVLLLVCIAVFDLRTTYIPDRWTYVFSLLAFISGILSLPSYATGDVLPFLIAAPLIAAPLAALWVVSQGAWMGLGDVKLALGFGWLVGTIGGYLTLGLSFVIGAVIGVILIGITRFVTPASGFTMKSEVPFGPFLILSLCIVWFSELYNYNLLGFLVRFLSLS
jgi:prepilin signal peptidase PulO-like enzyme (type II secretory pathway)